MKTLKEKYPDKYSLALQYHAIGLPERYWFSNALSDSKLQRWLTSLEGGEWVAVIGENPIRISWLLSDILKNLDGKSKFIDFGDLLVSLSNRATRTSAFLVDFDNIAINNIRRSSLYDAEIQLFISYLNKLYNSPRNKNVIIGLEREYSVETIEVFEELTYSLYRYFPDWDKERCDM